MNYERIVSYFSAWDASNNRGVLDVQFGDPGAPQATRIQVDNAAELSALLAILRSSRTVYISADDAGRVILKSEWTTPGGGA
ncbi:MAG: hypothetical protein HEQ23_15220 [Tepidisphaera sp.]